MKKILLLTLVLCLALSTVAHAFNAEDVSDTVQLVNTKSTLDDTYLPDDLLNLYNRGLRVSSTKIVLRHEATYAAEAMFSAMSADNIKNYMIVSGYRSFESQTKLFTNKSNTYLAAGLSESEANAKAATSVAIPGTSEHQTGYVLDISTQQGGALNSNQGKTEVAKWLAANSHKFGYILRYPSDKTTITGIIYEPWHFRYVGMPHSQLIYERGFCLEEYFELLKGGEILKYTNDFGIDFEVSYVSELESIDSSGASVSLGDSEGYIVTQPIHNPTKTVFRWN